MSCHSFEYLSSTIHSLTCYLRRLARRCKSVWHKIVWNAGQLLLNLKSATEVLRGNEEHCYVLFHQLRMSMFLQKWRKKRIRISWKGRRLFPNFLSSFRDSVEGHPLQFMAAVLVHPLGLSSVKFHFLLISITMNSSIQTAFRVYKPRAPWFYLVQILMDECQWTVKVN